MYWGGLGVKIGGGVSIKWEVFSKSTGGFLV